MHLTRAKFAALLVTGVVGGGIIGAASLAGAAIPDPSGTITACYSKTVTDKGATSPLQLVDTAKRRCPAGSTALTWNQKGVPGPQGPPGPQGVPGGPGPRGPAGADGALHLTERKGAEVTIAAGGPGAAWADCLSNEVVVDGGYMAWFDLPGSAIAYNNLVGENRPNGTSGWFVNLYNLNGAPIKVQVHVTCAAK